MNMGTLEGGVVVVSGGGSGIGRATAQRAAREGAAVAVLDKHAAHAEATATMIREAGGRAAAYPCDVGDEAEVAAAVTAAASELGRVTGVVTAAGIFHGPDLQPAHQVTVDDFVTVLRVNLVGTFAVIKHALPHLVDGGGAIVTIASTAAIRGHGFGAGYTASKGGVDALTRLLAVQYGKHGVRANCICPGRRRHADDRRHVRDTRSRRTREAHGADRASRATRRHRRCRSVPAHGRRASSHRGDTAGRRRRDDRLSPGPTAQVQTGRSGLGAEIFFVRPEQVLLASGSGNTTLRDSRSRRAGGASLSVRRQCPGPGEVVGAALVWRSTACRRSVVSRCRARPTEPE